MVLVTLGTQRQPFVRLLDYVRQMNLADEVLFQAGHTPLPGDFGTPVGFVSYAEMAALVERADLVITHGGTGSMLMALAAGKKVVACARLARFGEHVDDHQTEMVDTLSDAGYLMKVDETTDWDGFAARIAAFVPAAFESNTDNFVAHLRAVIMDVGGITEPEALAALAARRDDDDLDPLRFDIAAFPDPPAVLAPALAELVRIDDRTAKARDRVERAVARNRAIERNPVLHAVAKAMGAITRRSGKAE